MQKDPFHLRLRHSLSRKTIFIVTVSSINSCAPEARQSQRKYSKDYLLYLDIFGAELVLDLGMIFIKKHLLETQNVASCRKQFFNFFCRPFGLKQ